MRLGTVRRMAAIAGIVSWVMPARAVSPPLPRITTGTATLFARFEADAGLPVDGSLVSTWADQSGQHRNLTNRNGVNRPVFHSKAWPGGRPCVSFAADSLNYLQGESAADWKFLSDGSSYTVFMVWRTQRLNPGTDAYALWGTCDGDTTTTGTITLFDNRVGGGINAIRNAITNGTKGNAALDYRSPDNALQPRSIHNTCMRLEKGGRGNDFTTFEWGVPLGGARLVQPANNADPMRAICIGGTDKGTFSSNIDVTALLVYKGALDTAGQNAINAYLEAKWHPAGNTTHEYCMDTLNQYEISGLAMGVTPLTKSDKNPILDELPGSEDFATWDYDKYAPTVIKRGPNDWVMYYGSYTPTEPRAPGAIQGMCMATSSDGLNWTKPNVGQVSYGGNTNNNMLYQGDTTHWFYNQGVYYDPTGAPGKKYLATIENLDNTFGTGNGSWIFGSENGITGWTRLATLYPPAPDSGVNLREPACNIVRRYDGRWVVPYMGGAISTVNMRYIGMFISHTPDPAGRWQDWSGTGTLGNSNGYIFTSTSKSEQFGGGLWVFNHYGLWIGFVGRLNSPDSGRGVDTPPNGNQWQDIWVSRDEGLTWYQTAPNYVPLDVGKWDSRFNYGTSLVKADGATWRIYYAGGEHGNNRYPHKSQIGFGTVPYERIGRVSGSGALTTRAIYQGGGVLTVNADASGSGNRITVACLDSQGKVIAGYGDADSTVVRTNATRQQITWGAKATLPSQITRVRFTVTGAALYSWSIGTSTTSE